MRNKRLFLLIVASFFASLTCAATMIIRIPSPATNGYLNLGDSVVLLSGFLLGPVYGAAAAGIGSMFADIFAGYVYYAPGTLAIKALVAFLASVLYARSGKTKKKSGLPAIFLAGCCAEAVMVLGYFIYESLLLGYGFAALAGIPGNILQGVLGIASATYLVPTLNHIPFIAQMTSRFKKE